MVNRPASESNLVRSGLATARERLVMSPRTTEVARMRITEAGRNALAVGKEARASIKGGLLRSLCLFSLLYPSIALTQPTSLLTPFVGVWSSVTGCGLLKQGRLDKMSTAEASRFGVVEISTKGIDWLYNSGTTLCEFTAGEAKAVAQKVWVPAVCSFKGEEHLENILLARTTTKLDIRFENGFWRGGTKVKCH